MRNESLVDSWTWTHVATGYVAGRIGVPWLAYAVMVAAYEVVEHSMESPHGHPMFGTKRPESALNVTGDVLAGVIGYQLGRR